MCRECRGKGRARDAHVNPIHNAQEYAAARPGDSACTPSRRVKVARQMEGLLVHGLGDHTLYPPAMASRRLRMPTPTPASAVSTRAGHVRSGIRRSATLPGRPAQSGPRRPLCRATPILESENRDYIPVHLRMPHQRASALISSAAPPTCIVLTATSGHAGRISHGEWRSLACH